MVSTLHYHADHIVKHRTSIFGHVSRIPWDVSVYQALCCQVDLPLNCLPDRSWKRRLGRPPKCWLDSQRPPADVRRDAVRHGHRGAMQRSLTTMQ